VEGELTAYDAGTGIIPDFRGQGLAKRMFDHALPGLQERGVKRFILEVLQKNKPAIKAYQKSGFEIARELKCFVAGTDNLRQLPTSASLDIRLIDAGTFEGLIPEARWSPSFENRFTAHLAIPEQVAFLGAYEGDNCVGAISYCAGLNWLLSLLVKRTHRHRGVGRSLLQHLASTLLPEDAPKLAALNVDGDDTDMQAFFEAVGFSHLIDQYEMGRRV
ncbi:GNAT family N-acetyltransferase, partial [Candidatus Bipolaricaulota bacterium]|nr:GNAT family N-acetyltransferase [Candidatus Bipolaricaulota bacterium]